MTKDVMDVTKLSEGFQSLGVDSQDTTSRDYDEDEDVVDYRDITERFIDETNTLLVGQLVQDPHFTLLEAVGALEIMDPKMDSGLMPAITFNVSTSRAPEEVIGIMDQLFSYEMAWHSGNSLSQTVFICLYIDELLENNPHTLEQAVFKSLPSNLLEQDEILLQVIRAYCLGVIKCCGLVNARVKSQYVLEEEDFATSTYSLSLLDSVTPEHICGELKEALKQLCKISGLVGWSDGIQSAIQNRLSLRLAMLKGFSLDVEGHLYHDIGASPWEICLELSTEIEKTHEIGKPVEEAFSTHVQRRLASNVPPRPKVDMQFTEAVGFLKQMCQEMKEIAKILEYVSPGNILTFLLRFNARKHLPSTYVRMSLQSLLIQNWVVVGKVQMKTYVLDDLKELCCPLPKLLDSRNKVAEAPQSVEFNISKRINWFVDRSMNLMLSLFQKLCMNRPRLRRMLCHALLEWDAFQTEAEEIDTELRDFTKEEALTTEENTLSYSYPLSSWVFHYKLRIMEWVVFLGFELEIYQPYEYASMYWVVQYYLGSRILHLDRIRNHLLHQASKPVPDEWIARQQETLGYITFLTLEAKAQHDLVAALLNTYRLILSMDLVKIPPQPYGAGDLRFMLRMKPFQTITVPEGLEWDSVPWEYFQPQKEKGVSAEQLVDDQQLVVERQETVAEATYYINEARSHFELLNKIRPGVSRSLLCEDSYKNSLKDILHSCTATSVAISLLGKTITDNNPPTEKLEVEIHTEKYHPWFPVPVITIKE